jgi:hypothetical protein
MPNQKISELTAIVTVDNSVDVLPIVDISANTTKKVTPNALKTALALDNVNNTSDANKPVSIAQQDALNAKVDENAPITAGTAAKITYDAKGLVTSGDSLDETDLPTGINANKIGTGAVSTTEFEYLNGVTSAIQTQLNAKQATLVSGTNIKTINSTSLLGNGDITISAIPSGVSGAIQFSNGSAFANDAANFFWDDTNKRLGIGTNSPASPLSVVNTIALAAGATNPSIENIAYTINNTGAQTGTATGILLNATETALNNQTHNLMDLQRAGVSNFKVGTFHNAGFRFNTSTGNNYRPMLVFSRIGDPTSTALLIGVGSGGSSSSAFIASNNDDMYFGTDVSNTFTTNIILPASGVGKILLGGATSSFPMIKRNGTAIDFRLADDSGFTNISANNANLGSATTGSQLSVRGDGTNPIARFENPFAKVSFGINSTGDAFNIGSGGNIMYVVNHNGNSTIDGKALAWYANIDTSAGFCFSFNDNNIQSYTTGTGGMLAITDAIFSPASGSANFRPTSIQYTLNASGGQTGTATGIFLNATETALNGLTHNLMDLQVGGASRFRVSNAGAISIGNTVASAVAVASTHKVTVVIGGTTYYLLATNI